MDILTILYGITRVLVRDHMDNSEMNGETPNKFAKAFSSMDAYVTKTVDDKYDRAEQLYDEQRAEKEDAYRSKLQEKAKKLSDDDLKIKYENMLRSGNDIGAQVLRKEMRRRNKGKQ